MKIFIAITYCKKQALAFLAVLLYAITGFSQTQTATYSAAGTFTWTAPCGVTSITVQAWGGGGAGGGSGSNNSKGGGGGAGGTYVSSVLTVIPGNTYSLSIGSGAVGTSSAGSKGVSSWFNSITTLLAPGGNGGAAPTGAGGTGSTAGSYGTIKIAGANGGTGSSGIAGAGGAGANGGGSGGGARASEGNGKDGSQPGGGGGGAFISDNSNHSGGNGGDGEIIITYTGLPTYCTPSFTAAEPITYVGFAGINPPGINNSTSAATGSPGYESSCLSADVIAGNSYAIQVKGNTVGNYLDYITVFIDWNQDGTFNQPNEKYYIGTLSNTTGTDGTAINSTIAVPSGASLGLTRMRVYKYWAGYGGYSAGNFETDACNDNNYGQAEDYAINVTTNCAQPTGASVTDSTNTSTGSLTVCSGTQVTLTQTGGTVGSGTWEWRTGSCTGTLAGTSSAANAGLTVTPPVGTTTYYVHSTCGAATCASVTVVVKTSVTITLASGSKDFPACKGINNASYVSYNLGSGGTGASVTGLPSGLTYNATGSPVVISGTPTVTGTFTYTVTPAGNSPCVNTGITGTITVSEAPITVAYSTPVTYCSGAMITPNMPVLDSGGTPTLYSASGLPPGLIINSSTGVISGIPTGTSLYINYTVTASNNCGSVNTIVRIRISAGDSVYNIIPAGTQDVCTPFSGTVISLDGSESGKAYQLYRNGTILVRTVTGTGSPISFGNKTAPGIYTVTTNSSCPTNMNGSLTINITQQPTTTFTYSNYSWCNQGLSSAALFTGSPLTGTFSSNPAGVVFNNNVTGVVDLVASAPGTYTIIYIIAASGGCGIYTATQTNFQIGASPQVYNVFGGGGYCSGGSGTEVGLDNSEAGVNYQLYLGGSTLITTMAGTGTVISFGNQTVAGTYTVVAVKSPCNVSMNGSAIVTINPLPSAISINASPATFCRGTIVPLTATTGSPISTTGSVNPSSGTMSLSIPDNNASGGYSLLKVTGIPAGATITDVSVNFRITHNNDGDLVINLKGPNGNVLNIANRIGGTGDNYGASGNNTIVSSSSTTSITTAIAAFNATAYSPQAAGAVVGATAVTNNISNVNTFSGLYGSTASSANGNWILSVRDDATGTSGALVNWQIVISYATITNSTPVTWSSATDLFTDPGGITAYTTGSTVATVYANPSDSVSYTATSANAFGCSTNATIDLNVNASPAFLMQADYCNYPGVVRIISKSDIPVNNWIWSNGASGGTSADTSFIDVNIAGNYYVSALSAANGCPAKGVLSIAQELVTNGDFELGNTGFTTDYTYHIDQPGLVPAGQGELYDDSGTNGYGVGTDGQNYHINFWGVDHTLGNGSGNFMVVNGHGSLIIWKNVKVTVLPNTDYYFSAWGMSLNSAGPFAKLSFQVNGDTVGTTANLAAGINRITNNGWTKFYGIWNSGTNTSADIYIVDKESAYGGNDFGLDDISFGTLSTFLNLTSGVSTSTQFICDNSPITDITYEIGGDGSIPVVDGLPAGLSTYWNGRSLIIRGTPTQSGAFNYTVHGTGCNTKIANGTITIYTPASAGTFASGPLISACYGSDGSVALSGTVGGISKWQSSIDNTTWADISNTGTAQGYTNIQSPIYYRAIAQDTNGCGTFDTSAAVLLSIPNYWTGITSKAWNTGTNWSDNNVASFTNCNTVIIPAGTPNLPQLNNATSVVNINIEAGAHLDLNDKTLTISGTYIGTGTLTGSSASGLVITGNAGTIQFTANDYLHNKTTNNYLKALSVNGGSASAVIGDSLNITAGNATDGYGTVTVTNGKLYANSNLILKSGADGTARVDYSTGMILDTVTIERYIPPRRAWRFLSVPFSSSNQTIRDAWQEGVNNYTLNYSLNQNPHPGFGTHITGDNISTKGFDLNTTTNSSLKVWDPIISSWNLAEPWTINTNIASYPAYCLFVRGSRAVDLSQATSAATSATVLRMKGVLNQIGLTATKAYTGSSGSVIFVGNPYASSIDIFSLINSSAGIVTGKFWVWDPKMTGNNNVGGYVSYSDGYTSPGLSPGYIDAASTQLVESGQAFMVQLSTGSTSASMKFKESDKVANESDIFGKQAKPAYPAIYTNLMLPTANGLILADGVTSVFGNKFSAAVDDYDAKKLWNVDENITLVRNDTTLAIEFRPIPVLTDTLFYRMYLRQEPYVLQIFSQNFAGMPLMRVWLVDKYLNTQTEINLYDTTLYNFTPNPDINSYRNRFMLVFKRQFTGTPVPVTKIVNEGDPNSTGNANSIAATAGSVNIYPNPAGTGKVMLQFGNMEKGKYEVTVYSTKGQKLSSREIEYSGGTNVYSLPLNPSWVSGVYTIKIANEDTQKAMNLKLVISR